MACIPLSVVAVLELLRVHKERGTDVACINEGRFELTASMGHPDVKASEGTDVHAEIDHV